jgi:hypothetical protein
VPGHYPQPADDPPALGLVAKELEPGEAEGVLGQGGWGAGVATDEP